jgi:hypothetical protein
MLSGTILESSLRLRTINGRRSKPKTKVADHRVMGRPIQEERNQAQVKRPPPSGNAITRASGTSMEGRIARASKRPKKTRPAIRQASTSSAKDQ